jgi:hypothetical protein
VLRDRTCWERRSYFSAVGSIKLAREKMPAAVERDRLCTAVGSCRFRGYLDLLSARDGKRLGYFAGSLIL